MSFNTKNTRRRIITALFALFLWLFGAFNPQTAQAQTFTFECVCDTIQGANCDICNTQILRRSFNGLIIRRNGAAWAWVDEPYTIRQLSGGILQFVELGNNPQTVQVSRAQTPFATMQGFIDSTTCFCSSGTGGGPFYASDSIDNTAINPGDTLRIVGRGIVGVTLDSAGQKFIIDAAQDTTLLSGLRGIVISGAFPSYTIALPTATTHQTMRYDGTNWVASSEILNNENEVGIGGSPVGGFELYVNGATRSDGALVSRGTGNFTGSLASPHVRLWNTTPTTGDTWYLGSTDGGAFQVQSSNLGGTMLQVVPTTGQVQTTNTLRIGAVTGAPTTIIGRNGSGDVGTVSVGSGLSLSGGTLSATGGGITGSGAANRIAFWSGATSLSSGSNFLWNGSQMAVNSSSYDVALTVYDGAGSHRNGLVLRNSTTAGYSPSIFMQPYGYNESAYYDAIELRSRYEGGNGSRFAIMRKAQPSSAAVEAFTVFGSGVGIFTPTPTVALDVTGAIKSSGNYTNPLCAVNADGSITGRRIALSGNTTSNYDADIYGNKGIKVTTGNYGAIPNPGSYYVGGAVLDARGFTFNTDGVNNTTVPTLGIAVAMSRATPAMVLRNNAGPSLIAETGNIGILTSSPARPLHVNGAARITGSAGTPTGILGRDAAGDVANLTLGSGLSITSGTLSATATGTIGGSIAATQVAYGSGTNTITGEADYTYDATNNRLTIGTGTASAAYNAFFGAVSSAEPFKASGNVSGNMVTPILNTFNASNAGNNIIQLQTGGANGGDPVIQFGINGVVSHAVGVDNTDGDKFKITPNASLPGENANASFVVTNNSPPRIAINVDAPAYEFEGTDRARTGFWMSRSATLTLTAGAGMGTSPSGLVALGTANGGTIAFTSGTSPTANADVFTLTIPFSSPNTINAVIYQGNTQAATDCTKFYIISSTNNSFTVRANGTIAASTSYSFRFVISG